MEKFKRNRLSSLPSPPSSSGSEPEKRPEIQPEYEWKARELRVVSGTYIPPQGTLVFAVDYSILTKFI